MLLYSGSGGQARQHITQTDARAILHAPLGERVREYAYLVTIAVVALAVGVAALLLAQPGHGQPPSMPDHQMSAPASVEAS